MRKLNYKHKKLLRFLVKNQRISDKKLIDAGGYEGVILDNLPKTKMKVLLDNNNDHLKESNIQHRILANIENIPIKDRTFDICIFSEVLEHLNNANSSMKELCRIADKIIVTTPNNSPQRKMLWKLRRKSELSSSNHIKEYSWFEVIKLFYSQGFKLKEFKGISFIVSKPYFLKKLEIFPKLSAKVLMCFEKNEK